MKKILLIFDEDKDYGINLAEKILSKKLFGYEVQVYSDADNIDKDIEVELLITTKDLPIKYNKKLYIVENETNDECNVYKYQSVDNIISKIILINGIENINVGNNKSKLKIIHSRFNQTLTEEFLLKYKNKENIVLINIDSLFLTDEAMIKFDELIYLLETDVEKLKIKIFDISKRYKNLIISGTENLTDIINYKNWNKLLKVFIDIGKYEEIIIIIPFLVGFDDLISIADEKIYLKNKKYDVNEERYITNLRDFNIEIDND